MNLANRVSRSMAFGICGIIGIIGGCQPTDAGRVRARIARHGLSEKENRQKISEITERIKRAHDCQSLSFTAKISEPPATYIVRVELAMAERRFKTRAFVDEVPVIVWTLLDGIFEEYKLAYWGSPEEYAKRPAENPSGPDDVVFGGGIERHLCSLGSYYVTWLGKDNPRINYLRERIGTGYWLGLEKDGQEYCDVVACLPVENYGGTEIFYVRADGFLHKWESIRPVDQSKIPRLMRIRRYGNYQRDQVSPDTWRFEKP